MRTLSDLNHTGRKRWRDCSYNIGDQDDMFKPSVTL